MTPIMLLASSITFPFLLVLLTYFSPKALSPYTMLSPTSDGRLALQYILRRHADATRETSTFHRLVEIVFTLNCNTFAERFSSIFLWLRWEQEWDRILPTYLFVT